MRIPFTALLLLALAGLPAGCYRSVEDPGQTYVRSSGPWSVQGIRLGMSRTGVLQRLGAAEKESIYLGNVVLAWQQPRELSVTFDKQQRVIEIFGQVLSTREGQAVVSQGASEEEVAGTLGAGETKKSYRPSGSGVISLGRVLAGISHEYTDDNARYTLWVYENQLRTVRVQPK